MLATPGALPTGAGWLYEVKWDGMRVLADVVDCRLTLHSRSGRDVTTHFPELVDLLHLAPDVLLDGEVVLLDDGVPSFAALAERMHRVVDERVARRRPVTFMAFDVLRLYGVDLLARPFEERRATLERLDTAPLTTVSLSPVYTDGPALLAATAARGMEGVVAKRRDGVYRPGKRSPGWVKTTHRRTQACLVGGWRPERGDTGRGGAARIGSLLLGVLGREGLTYAGRVGSGLAGDGVQRVLGERLEAVAAPSRPFAEPVPRPDAAGARWCEPAVVVEVDHLGWTGAGRLRQPVFRALRDDLEPADAVREP
jgi:bifunctional non-homologous end joining protein LigD